MFVNSELPNHRKEKLSQFFCTIFIPTDCETFFYIVCFLSNFLHTFFDKYNKRISHTQLPLLIKNRTTITNNKKY